MFDVGLTIMCNENDEIVNQYITLWPIMISICYDTKFDVVDNSDSSKAKQILVRETNLCVKME